MRIASKLTLSLISVALFIFIGFGYYNLLIEQQDLADEIAQQTQLLGKSLQIAIKNAARDKQLEDIEELLAGLETVKPDLSIWVYDQNGLHFPGTGHAFSPEFQTKLESVWANQHDEQFFYPVQNPDYMAVILPLQQEHPVQLRLLVVVRSLKSMRREVDLLQRNLLTSAGSFALVAVPLCTAICWFYIGWPLKRLDAGMARIQQGDFSPLPLKNPHDEIGKVLLAFNSMALELDNARQKLKTEAQSRRHLQTALQEADKLITIGQLSAGLAHEIGSPLQILRGRAEYLQVCAACPQEVLHNAQILAEQAGRITRIVHQLLEFTRRRPPHFIRCDMRTPVQAVLSLLEYEARRRDIGLHFTAADELPTTVADSDAIQQIVLNLITNALAATPDGGLIAVTLKPSQCSPVGTFPTAEAVELCVCDNGCGMSEEVLAHVFEPFFTTRHGQGGVGLGLAVARSLVLAHHGSITAASVLGQGCTVTVLLPLDQAGL